MSKGNRSAAPIRIWAAGRLDANVRRVLERLARSDDVLHIAVMPDIHLARDVCIGTAFATSERVYPDAIGGDIGCGMAAIALDASADDVVRSDRHRGLLRALREVVPIHRHRAGSIRDDHADRMPDPNRLTTPSQRALASSKGIMQLGTLGTGNHFLELQHDDESRLWLMVHSGSRGMGQAVRTAHIDAARPSSSGLLSLSSITSAGRAYLSDMHWAREYAAASRRSMLDAAAGALARLTRWRPIEETFFDCDHNHIQHESHGGSEVIVHRKGAMRACRGDVGIVPGSLAAPSYHVAGRGVPEALFSSAHGAGRAMSRSEARRRITRDDLRSQLRSVYVDPRALKGLREEAPAAYKDVREVMRAQRKLVRIVRELTPLLSHKGARSSADST
jgi:tRNA-splicing ligase RtcB